MTETLYVDIDSTLILWQMPTTGSFLTEWSPNCIVIDFVNEWVRHRSTPFFVIYWSSGGLEYTRNIVKQVREMGITLPVGICLSKYPRLPMPTDIYLDDDPLPSFSYSTIRPKELEFPMAFNVWSKGGYKCLATTY